MTADAWHYSSDRHSRRFVVRGILAAGGLFSFVAFALLALFTALRAADDTAEGNLSDVLARAFESVARNWGQSMHEVEPWFVPLVPVILVTALVWLAIPKQPVEILSWDEQKCEPVISPQDETVDLARTRASVARVSAYLAAVYMGWAIVGAILTATPAVPFTASTLVVLAILPLVVVLGASTGRYSRGSLLSRFVELTELAKTERVWADHLRSKRLPRPSRPKHANPPTERRARRRLTAFQWTIGLSISIAVASALAVILLSPDPRTWFSWSGLLTFVFIVILQCGVAVVAAAGMLMLFTSTRSLRWTAAPFLLGLWIFMSVGFIVGFWAVERLAANAVGMRLALSVGVAACGLLWVAPIWRGRFAIAERAYIQVMRELRASNRARRSLRDALRQVEGEKPKLRDRVLEAFRR